MYRVITDFITDPALDSKPQFILLCDNKSCWQKLQTAIPDPDLLNVQDYMMTNQEAFLKAAVESGWLIGWDQQLCPGHFKQLMRHKRRDYDEYTKHQENLVQLAANVPLPKDFKRRN